MFGTWEPWGVWLIMTTIWLSIFSWVDHFRIKNLEKKIKMLESRL